MLSPNNLVSSTSTYSHGQNRGMIAEPHREFAYGTTDPNPGSSTWTSNTTSSNSVSPSPPLSSFTRDSSSYLTGEFGPGQMSYPLSYAHGPGRDSLDIQQGTGYSAISADDETASASYSHSWRYPNHRRIVSSSPDPSWSDSSDRRVVSPGPSSPEPLHRMGSGTSRQQGLLGVRRVRRSSQATRPHPYRDGGTANRRKAEREI